MPAAAVRSWRRCARARARCDRRARPALRRLRRRVGRHGTGGGLWQRRVRTIRPDAARELPARGSRGPARARASHDRRRAGSARRPRPPDRPIFARPAGAFVTVHVGGELRGCIGIPDASRAARRGRRALRRRGGVRGSAIPADRRRRARRGSTSRCRCSRRSCRLTDLRTLDVGRHGLVIEQGWHRGLLLPQVATEHGWSATSSSDRPAARPALPPTPGSAGRALSIFEAEVFSEGGQVAGPEAES